MTAHPYLIPVAILSELAYILERRGRSTQLNDLLGDLETGFFELDCGEENIPRMRQLMERYADLPLGLTDASVIACAEQHGGKVLSLDRDFWVVARENSIQILPD
jgi:predicted nucleic acid-binding protein